MGWCLPLHYLIVPKGVLYIRSVGGIYLYKLQRLIVGMLLLLILVSFGCVKENEATFVYGQPTTIAAAPLIIAHEKGFWKESGLNVQVQRFSAGRLALDATISGSIQANSVSETGPVLAILNGNKIVIVGTAGTHKETKFVGRKDKGITAPIDLKGKRIATLPGTNSDYFMYVLLQQHGLDVNDVQIVSMTPPDMISALIRGDIDGFFAWEPHIYYAKTQLNENAVVFEPGDLYNGYHALIMRQDFVQNNPKQVEMFLEGILKAEKFIENNRKESVEIVAKQLDMQPEAVDSLWNEYDFSLKLENGLLDSLNKEAIWAIDYNVVPKQPVPILRTFIFTSSLKSVDSNAVSIQ